MTSPPARRLATLLGFGATLFASAALLFCVEPMVAKMLMPLLGGAPAVWITCMLFFQAALLLGYAYAHATTAWLGVRRQALLHVVVILLPLLVLPIHVPAESVALLGREARPVLPLLGVLATVVGLPFFVVGATGPLVQRWFSAVSDDDGRDPYFLYGASNLGSLLALAAYPVVIEPWIGLSLQTRLWARVYVVLAVLLGVSAVFVFVRARASVPSVPSADAEDTAPISWTRRARWVVYAFVPSSLLLGVTSYITTDVAPVPLFWIVPLALYLTTFVLVFARRPPLRHAFMVRALPFGVSATVMILVIQATTPMPLILFVHLGAFFLAAMVCHGELAADRPGARHLTEFYLWISVGGVLGGVANGLVAPQVFGGLDEYPIALVLAVACRRVPVARERSLARDLLFASGILALTYGLVMLGQRLSLDPTGHVVALVFVAPWFLTYAQLQHPRRYALAVAAMLLGATPYKAAIGETIHVERNFFGVTRVTRDAAHRFIQIAHGDTIHGRQWQDAAKKDEPTAYYTREGPLGQVFAELHAREETGASRVAVVGLGAGTMAAYAREREAWTFYEINPAVVRVATDPRYFTFLEDAFERHASGSPPDDSPRLHIVIGDARLRLADASDASYDLLVIDAFSSDAIPAHLLTREAFALYLRKLTPRGLLVLHISNRYLDLQPALENLATDARLTGFIRRDDGPGDASLSAAWTPSVWTALTRSDGEPPAVLARDARWQRFSSGRRAPWTDDFSDLVSAFRW